MIDQVYLVANGDQRLSANQLCWPAQQKFEELLVGALRKRGLTLTPAPPPRTPPRRPRGTVSSPASSRASRSSVRCRPAYP